MKTQLDLLNEILASKNRHNVSYRDYENKLRSTPLFLADKESNIESKIKKTIENLVEHSVKNDNFRLKSYVDFISKTNGIIEIRRETENEILDFLDSYKLLKIQRGGKYFLFNSENKQKNIFYSASLLYRISDFQMDEIKNYILNKTEITIEDKNLKKKLESFENQKKNFVYSEIINFLDSYLDKNNPEYILLREELKIVQPKLTNEEAKALENLVKNPFER